MNYKIILDREALYSFVRWLPDLEEGECYYVALFARKKYHESAKNDKSQCKRLTATDKEWLIRKLEQLEVPLGCYTNKDGTAVANEALALYISVNPRSFARAQRRVLCRLADTIAKGEAWMNPTTIALSEIQKAKSRTCWVDFDFDDVTWEETRGAVETLLNPGAYQVLNTRSGFHLLVAPHEVHEDYRKTWHQGLTRLPGCDQRGDNLIPVAGCCQGGYVPRLLS